MDRPERAWMFGPQMDVQDAEARRVAAFGPGAGGRGAEAAQNTPRGARPVFGASSQVLADAGQFVLGAGQLLADVLHHMGRGLADKALVL